MTIKLVFASLKRLSCRHLFRILTIFLFSFCRRIKRSFIGKANHTKIPGSLFIYTTQSCNLRCKGCISLGYPPYSSPNETILDKAVEEGHSLGVNSFIFLGGEPVLESSFTKILSYAKRYKFTNFNIVTNGTLLDANVINGLKDNPNIILFVSIDGLRTLHDARRGGGTYDVVIKNLSTLKSEKIPFFVISTVTKENFSEILSDSFVETFKTLGCLGNIFLPYLVNGCVSDQKYELDVDHWRLLSSQVSALKKANPDYFLLDVFELESRFAGCRAVSRSLAITVDGSIQPCPALMVSMDNLSTTSLLSCLSSPLLQFISQLKAESPSECLLISSREIIENYVSEHKGEMSSTSESTYTVLENGFSHFSRTNHNF